jgi:hypothetical protein
MKLHVGTDPKGRVHSLTATAAGVVQMTGGGLRAATLRRRPRLLSVGNNTVTVAWAPT